MPRVDRYGLEATPSISLEYERGLYEPIETSSLLSRYASSLSGCFSLFDRSIDRPIRLRTACTQLLVPLSLARQSACFSLVGLGVAVVVQRLRRGFAYSVCSWASVA